MRPVIAGVVADAIGYGGAITVVAGLTGASGLWVLRDMAAERSRGIDYRISVVSDAHHTPLALDRTQEVASSSLASGFDGLRSSDVDPEDAGTRVLVYPSGTRG